MTLFNNILHSPLQSVLFALFYFSCSEPWFSKRVCLLTPFQKVFFCQKIQKIIFAMKYCKLDDKPKNKNFYYKRVIRTTKQQLCFAFDSLPSTENFFFVNLGTEECDLGFFQHISQAFLAEARNHSEQARGNFCLCNQGT